MSTETPEVADPTAHWSFETKQIHAGQTPDVATNARALPIYQTTSYTFNDTDHAAALFGLAETGNIYTRIMNPTQDVVEQRIAALEGGVAALFLASGQAAETLAILNLANAGDHIVSSPRLYGGTYNLFHYTLPKLGIDVSSSRTPTTWIRGVRPRGRTPRRSSPRRSPTRRTTSSTSPTSPRSAHDAGVPLIVDNTVATPYLIQPLSHGADIVVHSATKYLGGHGAAIAGVIVDGGTFDWTNGNFPGFTTPDPSYHGVVFAELGPPAFALKARVQLLRDLGSAAAPFNAFLIAQGLETLSLRVERHVANAQKVAEYLAGHEDVVSVNYAGLPTSPWYELGKKLAPKGTGAVLAFELAGGVDAGKAFVNALTLHSHVANIGDVRSLVIHPASTTHAQLTAAGATGHRCHPGTGAPRGRHRGHRRHPGRPGAGFRRRQTVRGSAMTISEVPTLSLPAEGEVGVVDIGPLTLENGAVIEDVSIAVQRWGELSPNRDNVVVVLHALTGDSHVTGPVGPGHEPEGWWEGVAGPGAPIDTDRWCAIATNVLGGCRGSTGPSSPACRTESRGAQGFPWCRCATRSRPISPRLRRWASPRSPRWSAARWAAPARWSGPSAIPTRCARRWCLPSGRAPLPIRSAPRAHRSPRSSPTRTGATATTTAPGGSPDLGMEIARRFAHLTYRGEAELDTRFANDPQGRRRPGDRWPLLGAELPRASGPQAARPFRRGHLCVAHRSRCPAMTSAAAAAESRRRCAAARFRWSSAASRRTGCTRFGCRRSSPSCCQAVPS